RICGASTGAVKLIDGSGPVVFGDGEGCAANHVSGAVMLTGNAGSVTVVGNAFAHAVKATANSGSLPLTGNTIAGSLKVKSNTGTVVDTPNTVQGKTKIQARRRA